MSDSDNLDFKIKLENYSGPLDVLLHLAKSQKVNLVEISIAKLADQFIEFINSSKETNLDLASEYLVMATWLTYLKSKLLLPDDDEDDFKALEVAERLKLQLKKLELIRILSDKLLQRKRIGFDVFFRGLPEGVRSIHSIKYDVSLYDILKSYSNFKMRQNFLSINISKLPVFTTEQGIQKIKNILNLLIDWKDISEIIPKEFTKSSRLKKSGLAGIFCAALELSREGSLTISQKNIFDKVLIKKV